MAAWIASRKFPGARIRGHDPTHQDRRDDRPRLGRKDVLRELVKAGVNVCRLNFSHGTHEDHEQVLLRVRKLEVELGRPVAILQASAGPRSA